MMQQKYKLFILLAWLATLNSPLNFYFLLFVMAMRFWFFAEQRRRIFLSVSVLGFLSIPFLLPYYFVSHQFGYVRPVNDAIHFSLQFPDLLNISNIDRLSAFIPPTSIGTPDFLGVGTFLLLLLALLTRSGRGSLERKYFIWTTLAAFVLALGPALHLTANTVHIGPFKAIPLPYIIPYYLLPGFSGFRTPSRWILLAALALTIWSTLKLLNLRNSFIYLFLIVVTLLEISLPLKYARVPVLANFPEEQRWLENNYLGQPIIQFPIYNWSDQPEFGHETLREYYSTIHWHPMYNGYSGFSPKEWESRVEWLQEEFPSSESLDYLRNLKIRLVLTPVSWSDRMEKYPQMELIARFSETNIYELK